MSTTDPDARVMKMMDGGFRPAYNVQFATDVDSHVVVGVAVTNGGEPRHLCRCSTRCRRGRGGRRGARWSMAGMSSADASTAAARAGCRSLCRPEGPARPGRGLAARPDDPAVLAWRARMATRRGEDAYRVRAATAERVNADGRGIGRWRAVPVRGLRKVHTWVLWIALAQNLMRAMELVPHQMM